MPHDRSPHSDSPSSTSAAGAPEPLSIANRRKLQAKWEQAWNALRAPSPDSARIHELIRECVTTDPASPVYVDVLLANCHAVAGSPHHNKKVNWFRRWQLRARLAASVAQQDWPAVFRDGPDALFANPSHLPILLALADACSHHKYGDSAWKYLEAALDLAPDEPEVQRRAGRALLRRGQFGDAASQWRRLVERSPDDEEARRWLTLLPEPTGDATSTSTSTSTSPSADVLFAADSPQAADARCAELLAARRFAAARQWLAQCRVRWGQNLAWNDRAGDVTIAEHWEQVEIARRLAAADPEGDWSELVGQLSRTALRVEVELLANRVQRNPSDARLKFRLAAALKRQGNWSEAIRTFEGAEGPSGGAAEARLEQGECWQRLRQFSRAIDCYRLALDAVGDAHDVRERIVRRIDAFRGTPPN